MTELPTELTIIPEDHGGCYANGCDCTIARALKRAGVRVHRDDGYCVCGYGIVRDSDRNEVGQYRWKESNVGFDCHTTHDTGTLILTEVDDD